MFEPKMKKKTATFLNIKKKKLQNGKKNVTHILFMPKMKKKNCNTSDHFSKKKLQTLKKRISLVCCYGEKVIRRINIIILLSGICFIPYQF